MLLAVISPSGICGSSISFLSLRVIFGGSCSGGSASDGDGVRSILALLLLMMKIAINIALGRSIARTIRMAVPVTAPPVILEVLLVFLENSVYWKKYIHFQCFFNRKLIRYSSCTIAMYGTVCWLSLKYHTKSFDCCCRLWFCSYITTCTFFGVFFSTCHWLNSGHWFSSDHWFGSGHWFSGNFLWFWIYFHKTKANIITLHWPYRFSCSNIPCLEIALNSR